MWILQIIWCGTKRRYQRKRRKREGKRKTKKRRKGIEYCIDIYSEVKYYPSLTLDSVK